MDPIEHNGHTITLTDDHYFAIAGPLVKERGLTTVPSFREAQEKIDDLVAAYERQQRVKLSIPVWLDDGSPGTVTGVHGGHLKELGVGLAYYVYPQHPQLGAILVELDQFRERVRKLSAAVSKYRVTTAAGYSVKTFDAAVADLQKRISAAEAMANADFATTLDEVGARR